MDTEANFAKKILKRIELLPAIAKSIAVFLSYWLGSLLTFHIHENTAYIGAMLACTSAIVVLQKEDLKGSFRIAWLRVVGTFIGAVMAICYLLLFPFSVLGMVIAVFVLDLICMLLGVPDNGKMAAVTLVIILIVSIYSTNLPPLLNGTLRFLESAIGTSIGLLMVWLLRYIDGHKKCLH